VRNCPGSLHIRQLAGENTHHILEAVFKGMGRALKGAAALDPRHLGEIPSTKGAL
jgi:imidazoleglycerol-phosphate dehydratase